MKYIIPLCKLMLVVLIMMYRSHSFAHEDSDLHLHENISTTEKLSNNDSNLKAESYSLEHDILELENLSPKIASENYRQLRRIMSKEKRSDAEVAFLRSTYLSNVEVKPWLIKTIKNEPHSRFNSRLRSYYFSFLMEIKESWVFDLLGNAIEEQLEFSDPEMTDEELGSVIELQQITHDVEETNQHIAANILSSFNIKGAPFQGGSHRWYGEQDIEKWRQWWLTNKDKLDQIEFVDGGKIIMPLKVKSSTQNGPIEKTEVSSKKTEDKTVWIIVGVIVIATFFLLLKK